MASGTIRPVPSQQFGSSERPVFAPPEAAQRRPPASKGSTNPVPSSSKRAEVQSNSPFNASDSSQNQKDEKAKSKGIIITPPNPSHQNR